MQLHCFVFVVLLISGTNSAPDIGDFFESIFKVFRPSSAEETIPSSSNVTDVHTNATDIVGNITEAASTTIGITVTSISDAKILETTTLYSAGPDTTTDRVTEDTTIEDTTLVTTESTTVDLNTTTVVYKLFHPNNTEAISTLSTTLVVDLTSPTADLTSTSTSHSDSTTTTSSAVSESSTQTTATSTSAETLSSTSGDDSTTLVLPLASSTLVNGELCSMSFNPETNLKVTTCADSSLSSNSAGSTTANSTDSTTLPSIHKPSKRFAPLDEEGEEEEVHISKEIGDDDYDAFDDDNSEENLEDDDEGNDDTSGPTINTNRQ